MCDFSWLFSLRIAAGFSKDLREEVFEKVTHFSNENLNTFSTSSLITRTTNDIQQLQMTIVMFLRIVMYAPIIGVGAILHVIESGKYDLDFSLMCCCDFKCRSIDLYDCDA